jgi:ribosomal protein S18 acetylase RimI-like enzyme
MIIRQFDYDQDLEPVINLWRNSFPQIRMSPSDDPKEIRKKLQRDADLFLVAEDDDHIVGAVLGGFDGRRGMVYHLAVETSRRGEGIGRNLMEQIEDRLRAKGCRKYYLLVTKDNTDTIGFYESLGCEVMDLFILGKVLQ